MNGRIVSIEHQVGLAGPGFRSVITLGGCPMTCARCPYEAVKAGNAREMTAEECAYTLFPYAATLFRGGVTLAGGIWEQPAFALSLLSLLKERGFHTALLTNGFYREGEEDGVERILRKTDVVICDIKAVTEEGYAALGGSLARVLAFLTFAEAEGAEIWLRMMIVPGENDREETVLRLRRMTAHLTRLEKIELIPYRSALFPNGTDPAEDCPDEVIERLQNLVI